MQMDSRNELSLFLEGLAETLDIAPSQYVQAVDRYKSIGRWLDRKQSTIRNLMPRIYPQGSFEIGTVVKPITDAEEYDIDLICELSLTKKQVSPKKLKNMVGEEIKSYIAANNMGSPAEETNRCWRMNYAEGARFHMDTLPAIPDGNNFRQSLALKGVSNEWLDFAIAITDISYPNFDRVTNDWLVSNPKGYAQWFRGRMATEFDARRLFLAKSLRESVQNISQYKVKTPLQQTIQILKRHRDMFFVKNFDDRPISSIITTLAAWAYNNESDLLTALTNVVQNMDRFIYLRDGISYVANPANPMENFAEKWRIFPSRKKSFHQWLDSARADFSQAQYSKNLLNFSESIKARIGDNAVNKALGFVPKQYESKAGSIKASALQPLNRFSVPHRQSPNWPVNFQGRVLVAGTASRDGFRPWSFQSDSAPLDKRCSLSFEATTDISPPFKVYWQVVNTGDEARQASSLRGDFYDGLVEKGGRTRRESTLYRGMHWVECFIVKNGTCVARSGEFVVNIK